MAVTINTKSTDESILYELIGNKKISGNFSGTTTTSLTYLSIVYYVNGVRFSPADSSLDMSAGINGTVYYIYGDTLGALNYSTSDTTTNRTILSIVYFDTGVITTITPIEDTKLAIRLRDNFAATVAPTVTDDITQGYKIGSEWINVNTDTAYKCTDNTQGAANWEPISGGGGGGGSHATLTNLLWTSSGHTGTANRIAAFDGSGNTTYSQVGVDLQAYDADLAALAALAATGIVARTGAGTAAVRTITAGSTKISVTNGDGVSGNPTIDVTEANLILDNLGGVLSITKGGTGQSTQTAAFDALAPTTTKGDLIVHNGSDNIRVAVGANDTVVVADSATASGIKYRNPYIVIQSTAPTVSNEYAWFDTVDVELYVADTTRNKWLSPAPFVVSAGRNANATNVYLRGQDGIAMNLSGFVVPYNCTIVAISAKTDGAETWTAEVRKNGSVTVIASLSLVAAASGYTTSTDVDLTAGDVIELYCNGTTIKTPWMNVFIKRKGS